MSNHNERQTRQKLQKMRPIVTKENQKTSMPSTKFKLGPLKTLHQVCKALGKTIRAMANGSLGTQEGARIANALGILRQGIETQALQRIEKQMGELADKA